MDHQLEKELDLLCLSLLELVAEIHEKKQEQEKYIQDGFLCLAKARYAVGVDRVSKLQYAPEMTPQLFVDSNVSEESSSDDNWRIFKCVRSKFYESANTEEEPRNSQELRKRHQPAEQDAPEDEDKELDELLKEMNVKEKPKPSLSSTDPLRWFGVLVPQSLRQAQGLFVKAAEISCDICTLRNKFEYKQRLYQVARGKQTELAEADEDSPPPYSEVDPALTQNEAQE